MMFNEHYDHASDSIWTLIRSVSLSPVSLLRKQYSGKIQKFSFTKFIMLLLCLIIMTPNIIPAQTKTRDTIFVPYDKMKGPELGNDTSIMVPYAEFLKLKNASDDKGDDPDFKAIASLVQATYKGIAIDNIVEFEAELQIEVLAKKKDILEIMLPFKNAAISSAILEGAPASLSSPEGHNEEGLKIILPGEGKRTLKLKLALPVKFNGAVKIIDMGLPRAAASSVEVNTGEDIILEHDMGATPASVSQDDAGICTIRASAGSGNRVLIPYRLRLEKSGAATQTRFSIMNETQINLSSQTAKAIIKTSVEVLTGSMDSMEVMLPENSQLQNVSGSFIKDWTEADQDGKCTISLSRKISEPFSIIFNLIPGIPEDKEKIEIPEFRIPGAVNESGTVIIKPSKGLCIWTESTSGLESISAKDPETKGWTYEQPGWKLEISRLPIPPRLRSDGILLYEVTEKFIRIKSRHHLSLSGRGIFNVNFQIPEGFDLREAGPDRIVSGFRQEGRTVEINFKKEQSASMDIELKIQRQRKEEEGEITIEPISVINAEEDTGNILFAVPRALRAIEIDAGDLEAVDVRLLMSKIGNFKSNEINPVLAYRYFSPVFKARITIEQQHTRVTCETSRLVSIMPSLMKINSTMTYHVEFSATDKFQVLLPASAGEDVRFSGIDIKEKKHSPYKNEKNPEEKLSIWTIKLQRKIIGTYRLGVSFEMPLKETGSGKSLNVSVPMVRAGNVSRETGFIGVARGENLEVSTADSKGLEKQDTKELPGELSSASLGFRYFDPEKHSLDLKIMRHELEEVLGALIRRIHIESVLTDQGEAVHEVIIEIQNNQEQYLVLEKLPEKMKIWSAVVRGTSVRPITRKSDNASLIELSKSNSRDEKLGKQAFRIRLILRETLEKGAMKNIGKIEFVPPVIKDIPILRCTWKVYLPRDYRYTDFAGTMRLEKGGKAPWIEPAAEKLLNDIPASIAGGISNPALKPQVALKSTSYDQNETKKEKNARLQGNALDIHIVKEGVKFTFSRLTGTGTITIHYWKKKSITLLQGLVAAAVFLILLFLMKFGKQPIPALIAAIVFFIAASLTSGIWGRIFATALSASIAAFITGLIIYIINTSSGWRKKRVEERIIPKPFKPKRHPDIPKKNPDTYMTTGNTTKNNIPDKKDNPPPPDTENESNNDKNDK